MPVQAKPVASLVIEINQDRLPQGKIGMIKVAGENIAQIRAAFLDHQYLFVPDENGAYLGLIAAPMETAVGYYRLSLLVTYASGQTEYLAQDIQVTYGVFDQADLNIPSALEMLLDPEILLDEFSILDEYLADLTPGATWISNGLLPPLNRPTSARFGTYRRFNGSATQRHTGVDYPTPIGTPIQASAGGVVVFNDLLPIRGQYILIDHGSGIFSGYAHLSATHVQVGEAVEQGQIIGDSGNSGRSTGAHVHWEVVIGGAWVDPLELMALLASNQ